MSHVRTHGPGDAGLTDAGARAEELQARTEALDDGAFLRAMTEELGGRIVFATSLGAEDQALTDMLLAADRSIPIVTLDTGRLPQETYDLIDATREHFDIAIEVLFPDAEAVAALVRAKGANSFYASIENRKECCAIRKVAPLGRALQGYDAWITGLRRAQSPTRADLKRVEYDAANDMIKINPLIDWSSEQVWQYIRRRGIPYNRLHDNGFPSIGCLPCTRAVLPGEDERAGRWWWERPDQKECGIHIQDGKVTRVRKTVGDAAAATNQG
jgi:phosphoadenosine phosphosulfate reductase